MNTDNPRVGDVWRAKKDLTYTSAWAKLWGRGRLVNVTSVTDEGVTYQYITGSLAGGWHTMPLARFRSTYERAGRIDDEI